jgi:hypothetical protein
MGTRAIPSRLGATVMIMFVLAAGGAALFGAAAPDVRGEENDSWVPVTLIYHSDVKGKIEPCW